MKQIDELFRHFERVVINLNIVNDGQRALGQRPFQLLIFYFEAFLSLQMQYFSLKLKSLSCFIYRHIVVLKF